MWQAYAWSAPPYEHRRSYAIECRTEAEAAQEALTRLIEEVECLDDGDEAEGQGVPHFCFRYRSTA